MRYLNKQGEARKDRPSESILYLNSVIWVQEAIPTKSGNVLSTQSIHLESSIVDINKILLWPVIGGVLCQVQWHRLPQLAPSRRALSHKGFDTVYKFYFSSKTELLMNHRMLLLNHFD